MSNSNYPPESPQARQVSVHDVERELRPVHSPNGFVEPYKTRADLIPTGPGARDLIIYLRAITETRFHSDENHHGAQIESVRRLEGEGIHPFDTIEVTIWSDPGTMVAMNVSPDTEVELTWITLTDLEHLAGVEEVDIDSVPAELRDNASHHGSARPLDDSPVQYPEGYNEPTSEIKPLPPVLPAMNPSMVFGPTGG